MTSPEVDLLDVAVVGGGAAGLATAIFAARREPAMAVAVLDGAARPGAKILVSGGGRCNVTNAVVSAADYWGGSAHIIRRVLSALPVPQTVTFFEELGVALHEEPGGKLFPDTNSARTVLDGLLGEVRRLGVSLLTGYRVTGIRRSGEGMVLDTSQRTFHARRVVLATGGRSLPKTGSDGAGYQLAQALGHTLIPPTPALAPLILEGTFHAALSGISQDVELIIRDERTKPLRMAGAMLWTHFGISGPVAMNASRHWHRAKLDGKPVQITACFVPGESFEKVEERFTSAARTQPKTALHNVMADLLPARMADAMLAELKINRSIPMAHLSRELRRRLVHDLLEWPLAVKDSRGYNYAEATAGGVPLDEIDSATMESRRCPGLYLVGEILDVDGRIGGFNFQWAWASGYVAADGLTRKREVKSEK